MKILAHPKAEPRLVAILVWSFIFILLLLPLHAFLSTWLGNVYGGQLVWKVWKEILIGLLVPLVVWFLMSRPDIARTIWARPINKIIALYVVLHLIFAVFSPASIDAVLAGLLMNLRFLAMFVLAQVIAASDNPWVLWLKAALPRWLLIIMIGLGVLALLQITIIPKDFLTYFGYDKDQSIAPYTLVDENPDALRAFATMRGPNTLGAYLLVPLAIAIYFAAKRRHLWLSVGSLLLGFLALMATGSRSAWIGFALMCLLLGLLWLPRDRLKKWFLYGAVPLIALAAVFLVAAVNVPALRLAVFHSSPGEPLFEGSTEKHWQAAADGAATIVANPLGQGVGTAGPASFYNANAQPVISESYFVQIGQEVGVLGLALFIIICLLLVRSLLGRGDPMAKLLLASFGGLTIICLFLHGWADDPTAMTWWGLAGLFMAGALPEKPSS